MQLTDIDNTFKRPLKNYKEPQHADRSSPRSYRRRHSNTIETYSHHQIAMTLQFIHQWTTDGTADEVAHTTPGDGHCDTFIVGVRTDLQINQGRSSYFQG